MKGKAQLFTLPGNCRVCHRSGSADTRKRRHTSESWFHISDPRLKVFVRAWLQRRSERGHYPECSATTRAQIEQCSWCLMKVSGIRRTGQPKLKIQPTSSHDSAKRRPFSAFQCQRQMFNYHIPFIPDNIGERKRAKQTSSPSREAFYMNRLKAFFFFLPSPE